MKKILLLTLLFYTVSCSNPEDRATGDPDSTSFNQSGNDKNFNTAGGGNDLGNQSNINEGDTSASPSTSKENANSKTQGTNRAYTRDSAKKQ